MPQRKKLALISKTVWLISAPAKESPNHIGPTKCIADVMESKNGISLNLKPLML